MSVVINGTTGITAAAFDGAVDAADLTGSLPAINGSALTNLPAPTLAQVLNATAGASVGAVGTYAICRVSPTITNTPGTTSAGSSLLYSDSSTTANGVSVGSGTWRLMGGSGAFSAAPSLWLRIS